MNEPPGLSSSLGIEAVEWLGQGTHSLTVRVRGRWRRRRPAWSGQPLLVIEVEGTRHRFPAMPEPPSLTGAAPGTWQLSFVVPATVAVGSGARAWLQLGSVVVPLPVPVQAPAEADEETLAQRRVRAAELAAESAARRLSEADARSGRLESRIAELEHELRHLAQMLADGRRALRAAEQRAHAERALREELEELVAAAAGSAEPAIEEQQRLRIEELERELRRTRRALDEARHAVEAATAGRRHAERQLEERAKAQPARRELNGEFELARRAEPVPAVRRPPALVIPSDRELLDHERRLTDARAAAESRLRSGLELLEEALARERLQREQADQRVLRAFDAIQEVREELRRLKGPGAAAEAPESRPSPRSSRTPTPADAPDTAAVIAPETHAATVEAERLSAALSRLRESRPPLEEPSPEPHPGWLEDALRKLARHDREAAALVLGALLPASQPDAHAVARMLAAGRIRRRLRRRSVRGRGRGALLELVDELLRAPITFGALRVAPRPALVLAAAMIEPGWSVERFTVAYDAGPFLNVRVGERALVSDTPLGELVCTIVCPRALLCAVLVGDRPPGTVVYGEQRPLQLLAEWLERAQSA